THGVTTSYYGSSWIIVQLPLSSSACPSLLQLHSFPTRRSSDLPLDELMAACRHYCETTQRRIFFEWTLIEGKNDSPDHARSVGRSEGTRLNSSHLVISYDVFCLKKKRTSRPQPPA